uniref:beta/gamma crystallin domain-containing protein 3-like n=1 Tax=Pristiophorus japonicus TaxID=55135 RepID=UPI00398F773C
MEIEITEKMESLSMKRTDYLKPEITLFEEAALKNGNNIFVNHDIPNLESIGYGTVTRSIEVKHGVWVAYHEEHYSGEQYILEKGVYRNYTDWGGTDSLIMSIRPIQLEPVGGNEAQFQLQAYNGIDFQGESVEFVTEMPSLPLQPNSFKVLRGCWVLYDEKDYGGCQYVLEEGHYPDLDSLGCLSAKSISSLKPIRNDFTMPSISLFSLYSFECQELILTEGASCLKDKGYYQYPKSVKVNSGIWIAYEHANFRGKQLLLEGTEIANWNKFSGWKTIGSIDPLGQPRVYFRIKNKTTGAFVTVDGNSEDPRGSKLSVCPYNGKPTQMWFYCNGLIKSKANYACIDIIGGHRKAGTKVNLWTENGRIHQKWNINRNGTISSFLDSNLRLDIKGGDFYDKNHLLLNLAEEQQYTQFWDLEVVR